MGHFPRDYILIVLVKLMMSASPVFAQSSYEVISVTNPGIIRGFVKWSGSRPPSLTMAINKDAEICDAEGRKKRDLDRLIIGSDGVSQILSCS